MLLYLIKIIALSIILFIINRVVLKLLLKGVNEDKLVKVSIMLTGIIMVLFILLSCGTIEGFENEEPLVTDGGDIKRNLEEAPNAESLAQDEEISENVRDNLQELLNKLQEKEEELESRLDIEEPRPGTNASLVITEGISGEKSAIEETKKMADQQLSVEETAEPEPISKKQEPRPTTDLEKIQNKYTILPIDQWMKPNAVDIINATPCMCPTVAPWGGSPLSYN